MNRPQADALVFFGASGDLAYKEIFPVLKAGTALFEYEPNTRGTTAELAKPPGGWSNPVVTGVSNSHGHADLGRCR